MHASELPNSSDLSFSFSFSLGRYNLVVGARRVKQKAVEMSFFASKAHEYDHYYIHVILRDTYIFWSTLEPLTALSLGSC